MDTCHSYFNVSFAESSDQNLTELLSVMETLKEQSLSLKFRQVKLVFTGTPRVGKSTLKKRIMKEMTNLSGESKINPSTGLEKPCVVQVPLKDGEAEQAAFVISRSSKESSHAWKNQKLEEQFSTLFDSMLARKVNPSDVENGNEAISPRDSKDDGDVAFDQPAQIDMESPSSPPVQSPSLPLVSPPSSQPSSPPSLVPDISSVVRDINWQKTKEQLALLEETTTVYIIMDPGGQPEFHEVLPLVLHGQALHLVL